MSGDNSFHPIPCLWYRHPIFMQRTFDLAFIVLPRIRMSVWGNMWSLFKVNNYVCRFRALHMHNRPKLIDMCIESPTNIWLVNAGKYPSVYVSLIPWVYLKVHVCSYELGDFSLVIHIIIQGIFYPVFAPCCQITCLIFILFVFCSFICHEAAMSACPCVS